ncbi:DUF6879 family protein [Nocardia crassostreae]|uniref:DUF6879 family protein n=1 Tax=Nocardia crassostreae TaxID=53428 RepID=UPI000832701A|nr:DUF6879 family protein [Nocardia crassostreae]
MLYRPKFDDLYRTYARAFHLEVQDSYGVASENEQLQRFLAGEPTSYPEDWQQWDAFVKEVTDAGTSIQRLRVVTEPHTDYTRFLLHHTDRNVAAGEQVRYLPRHQVSDDAYTVDDWWLFDDTVLAFSIFTPEGEWAGGAITEDPVLVSRCVEVRDRLWPLGIEFETYLRAQG